MHSVIIYNMQTWPIAHNTVKHVETGHIWDHLLCAEKTGVQLKLVYKLTKVSCIGTLYLKFIQDYVLFRVLTLSLYIYSFKHRWPSISNLSIFERTWWWSFQKRIVRARFDIYDFIIIAGSIPLLVAINPRWLSSSQ